MRRQFKLKEAQITRDLRAEFSDAVSGQTGGTSKVKTILSLGHYRLIKLEESK